MPLRHLSTGFCRAQARKNARSDRFPLSDEFGVVLLSTIKECIKAKEKAKYLFPKPGRL
jgi:hypothetical protein